MSIPKPFSINKYTTENDALIASIKENFYVVPCPLGTEPTALIAEERQAVGEVSSPAADNGKYLTCLARKSEVGENDNDAATKLYDLFHNHAAEDATYVMLNMPSGDISEAKYLLPIVNNAIDGYYDIERISFGTRTKFAKDGSSIHGFPTLRIKLGKHHPFDHTYHEGIVPRMANQIWSKEYLKQQIFDKSKTYPIDNMEPSCAGEPKAGYGCAGTDECDYVENID